MADDKKKKGAFKDLTEAAKEAAKAIGLPTSLEKLVDTGKEVLKLTTEFDGLANAIKFASANSIDAQANLGFVGKAITTLHLPMKQAYENFAELQEALEHTAIKGDNVRQVFEGIETAAVVQQLSTEKFGKIAAALKDMAQQGTVGTKQLNDLAAAMPHTMELAAESMGMGEEKLKQALQKGEINTSRFILNFSQKLKEHFEGSLAAAGQTVEAKMNDTQNVITRSMLDMGDKLRPVFTDIMEGIKDALDSAPVQWFIQNIEEVVKWVARAGETWVIYKGIMTGVEFVTETFAVDEGILTVSIGSFTAMTDGATLAVEGLGTAMATVGVFALAAGIAYLIEKTIEWNKEFDESIDKLTHFKEVSHSYQDIVKTHKELSLTFSNLNNLNADEKTTLYGNLQNAISQTTDKIHTQLEPALIGAKKNLNALLAKEPDNTVYVSSWGGTSINYAHEDWVKQRDALQKDVNNMQAALKQEQFYVKDYTGGLSQLQKLGIKPAPKPTFSNTNINTTHETNKAEGSKATTINIKINDLVKELNLHSTTIQGGARQIKDIITEVLLSAVNDSQQIAHD